MTILPDKFAHANEGLEETFEQKERRRKKEAREHQLYLEKEQKKADAKKVSDLKEKTHFKDGIPAGWKR